MSFSQYVLHAKEESGQSGEPTRWWLPHDFIPLYIEYLYHRGIDTHLPWLTTDHAPRKVPTPKVLLTVGQTFAPDTFVTLCQDQGLERTNLGLERGCLMVAGDTILLWYPAWTSPVRVEWWGDRVEAITVVDADLNSRFALAQLVAPPTNEEQQWVGWGTTKTTESLEWKVYLMQAPQAEQRITFLPEFSGFKGELSLKQRQFLVEKIDQLYVQNNHYQLYIATNDPKNVAKQYPELKKYHFVSSKTNVGWLSPEAKVVVLTDHELFGTIDIVNTKQNWLRLHTKIKVGDFVVHRDHGIARYAGIKRMVPPNEVVGVIQQLNPDYQVGQPVDYLHLQYAGTDELFVPYWQSQKVARYLGSGTHQPELTPLHSGIWQATTKRVQRAVEKISQDLVRLYAQRQQIIVTPTTINWDEVQSLIDSFRFTDTADQAKATREILADLVKPRPMDRLLVGDVGFGKTELAVRAAFAVVRNQQQVAILAPTTILTQQHLAVFRERLESFGVRVGILNRLVSGAEQRVTLQQLHDGQLDVIVGTHRLLAKDIHFKNLGLIVIDEEQNFGVKQKEKLKALRLGVHVLSMSATPIPRTLNFSILGVRDLSVIHSPPPNRKEVTVNVERFEWPTIIEAAQRELKRKGQMIVVYNKVLQIASFTNELAVRLHLMNPKAKVAFAHGQLPPAQLTELMRQFYRGEIDVLVASTIVQNGLDIPNANTLAVVRAERFGLAQLYQLKGRIGRSGRQAHAYFLLGEGEGYQLTKQAKRRLQAIEQINQLGAGFSIASQDMAIRGVGNLLGQEQHGNIDTVGFALYQQMLEEAIHTQMESEKVGK